MTKRKKAAKRPAAGAEAIDAMKNAQWLRTLGDYRKVVRDPLSPYTLFPQGESTSAHDAIEIALHCIKDSIKVSRNNTPETAMWKIILAMGTKYKLRNPLLLSFITLMEFAKKYEAVQPIDKLFPNLIPRPEPDARVFTYIGFSYHEAVFNFVREQGIEIRNRLKMAYRKCGKRGYKIPEVDNLEISPKLHMIIKAWFHNILKTIRRRIQESGLSVFETEAEFNSTFMQLEHEWNVSQKTKKKRINAKASGKKKSKSQLLRQTREITATRLLKKNSSMTCVALGKELGCHGSTASRLDAWTKNQQKRKGGTQKPPDGFKRHRDAKGSDVEAVVNGPQEDHLDIKQLIEDCKKRVPPVVPTAKIIMAKLSLKDEKEAERLTRETLHFFSELVTNTLD